MIDTAARTVLPIIAFLVMATGGALVWAGFWLALFWCCVEPGSWLAEHF
jgi:hypothetical protein